MQDKPARTAVAPEVLVDRVVIKFREDAMIRQRGAHLGLTDADFNTLSAQLGAFGIQAGSLQRHFSRPEADLDAERIAAATRSGWEIADLNLYYELTVASSADAVDLCDTLNALPFVELAAPAPIPAPAPGHFRPRTPDFSVLQDYRSPAPLGVGALDPTVTRGGDGAGRAFVDIEYSWTLDHEDLRLPASANVDPATNAGSGDHGTFVLGILVGADNDYGVTGLVPAASAKVAPVSTHEYGYNVARAVSLATAVLRPGDAILLEAQTWCCGYSSASGLSGHGLGPVEWDPATFDAIARATALGIVVVEAAGNGDIDLDAPSCERLFDRSWRDSGALIVGAGEPMYRNRLAFSSYGSRVDLQGWGDFVTTTGGGDLFNPGDVRRRYTKEFAGTSSATAMVAGVVLAAQGARVASGFAPYAPRELRDLLVATGQPQPKEPEQIGPLPDLVRATESEHSCPGDCDHDARVEINELVTAIRIALGQDRLDQCSPADQNGDLRVSVDELVHAVNSALGDCFR